jgi:pimeloyl-ACP methyl ester carboxylesterase
MYRASWVYPLLFVCMVRAAFAKEPEFESRPCEAAATAAGARCGVVEVPEDHARPRGRKIALNIVVLPATSAQRDGKRAQYDLEGGPGFAATDFLEFYAGEGAPYRQGRDIVLADMRGTGQSNPLRCVGIEEREKRDPALPMYPPDLVAECARQVSAHSDPRLYTTASAARDIDLVRRALGYQQLDLNAISYGTTLALRYMADFPKAVRAATLMGTVPANRTPPRHHAIAAQASLERLMADCAADSACRGKFGDVRANLATALQRLAASSVMTSPVFLEKLRSQLYTPAGRARVPYLLSEAARGDFRGFTGSAGGSRVFADGLYLSITCAESLARMDIDAAILAARASPFGAYRLERQRDACKQWVSGAADPHLMREPDSSIPVLFIAGDQDPVSPADWADRAARHFANGVVVHVPHGAHVLDGLTGLDTCLDAVMLQFFDSGSARGLDISCFTQMMPPAFGASH